MNLLDCYEILGLRVDAELATVKATYRRLARQFHPDVNRGDRHAQARFIQITQAYKYLLDMFPDLGQGDWTSATMPLQTVPHLSPHEHRLKWQSYQTLQQCLQQRRYARAIALTEGLAHRLPDDAEVRQWQGIIYLCWGTRLLQQRQDHKARTYLRKAILADPHNRALRQRVENLMSTMLVSAM